MNNNKEIIKSGATFQGTLSFIGLLLIILGFSGQFFSHNLYFLLFLLYPGFVLLLSIRGFEFDFQSGTFRHYFHWFFFRTGKSYSLHQFHSITLTYHNETTRMNSRGCSQTFEIRDFEIRLHPENGKPLLIHQFKQYSKAREFLHWMAEKTGLKITDYFEPVLKMMAEHRYQRRR